MTFAVALAAAALAACMAMAWWVQQRTGNSGWIDAIWTFGTGLVAAALALLPLGNAAPRRLFRFLQAQAAVGLLLAGSVMVAAHRPRPSWPGEAPQWPPLRHHSRSPPTRRGNPLQPEPAPPHCPG